MAVQEQTPYQEITANGVTTSFVLDFDCEDKDHLIVTLDGVEPPVGNWSLTGGSVVFTTAPANGVLVVIQRNTPFSRTTDYQSYNNSFRPGPVNKDFDWIWLKLQELGVADWILSNRIDALKAYVDDKDDELRAFLLAEIQAQGVSLDQLDQYYNYLMQRLAEIAVNRGWEASFVVDASGKTQQEINNGLESIAEMLAITTPQNGSRVYVKGVQGGTFVYDSTKSAVNDGVITFNGWVRQLDDNTITSEMVGIVGGEVATAKLDVLAAFMNGKSYNLKLNGSISTTKAFVLSNLSNSKIEVDDLYFVPPATTTLSQNRGAITVRNSINVTVRNGYLHGECVMYSADLEEGQAGIVFIDSTNCKAYNNRVERFHVWGILATNCSNTLAFNNTINHITRQSGINIWHGNGVNNIAFDNTITNIGLYGVEFENGTGLNDKGFSKSNIISDCFQGVTLVNLIDNATIVDNEINRCYRGITYSLSVDTRKLKISKNKVNDCRMGVLHGMANVQSSRNTFVYSAQSFYKTSPYSSVDYFDVDGYVYVADSAGKTNATTWTVGDSVQINGVTHTITEVLTGVTISPYTFNFVKIKFSVNPTGLKIGDFILKPPTIDNVGIHFFSTAYIDSQLDVIQGYATHYKESMSTTGNRRIRSPRIVDGTTVFLFDNSLSNLNCKFYVDDMQITGNAQLVDNAHSNSLVSIRYLVSNGYVRPNGYYTLNYFKPVSYGSFSLITQGRRTLKAMRFIAVELEYTGLATSTGNPAILINDQNFELSLGKVATTTPTDGIGFTVVNPFNAVSYLNTFKLTNTSAANDLGYTNLQYKLFYI